MDADVLLAIQALEAVERYERDTQPYWPPDDAKHIARADRARDAAVRLRTRFGLRSE